ncbi:MAG: EI24 domain-containing protein [Planctomycetes bacterium]|nr:EI24 domain-containing protein [Planctomycetota bacterium]
MNAPIARCPHCGYPTNATPCDRCGDTIRSLDGFDKIEPRAGFSAAALVRAAWRTLKTPFALLHQKAYIGLLKAPCTANVLVLTALVAASWWLLQPWFASWFDTPWAWFDGIRQAHAGTGAIELQLATFWLLSPTLLEITVGPLLEPLVDATERGMAGPGIGKPEPRTGVRLAMVRLQQGARVVVVQLLILPLVWVLALVPFVGFWLSFLIGAASAAVVWFEAPCARRGLDLLARLRLLRANWPVALGFGVGVQLAALVPFVNVLALAPMAAVAASKLFFRFRKVSSLA